MTGESSSDAVLRTQRTLAYAPEQVYQALTDPERLTQWWGPQGFRNTFDTFDVRVGGRWEFVMHGPDGQNYPNHSVFVELQPCKRWVIEHVNAPRFVLAVTLQAVGASTQVDWVQTFEDPRVAQAVRSIAEPGNEQNLDRLQALLDREHQQA